MEMFLVMPRTSVAELLDDSISTEWPSLLQE